MSDALTKNLFVLPYTEGTYLLQYRWPKIDEPTAYSIAHGDKGYDVAMDALEHYEQFNIFAAAAILVTSRLTQDAIDDMIKQLKDDDMFIEYIAEKQDLDIDTARQTVQEPLPAEAQFMVRRMREDSCKGVHMTPEYLVGLSKQYRAAHQ